MDQDAAAAGVLRGPDDPDGDALDAEPDFESDLLESDLAESDFAESDFAESDFGSDLAESDFDSPLPSPDAPPGSDRLSVR